MGRHRVVCWSVLLALVCLSAAWATPLAAGQAARPGVAPSPPAATATPPQLKAAPLDPAYVHWRALARRCAALSSGGGHGSSAAFSTAAQCDLGERPAPHALLGGAGRNTLPSTQTFPTSFDLRDLEKVSPVKSQQPYGTCWAFATCGSLESCLLPGEALDFSEDDMVLESGFDAGATPLDKYQWGGDIWMSTAYLTRWGGPVLESDDPYGDAVTPAGLEPCKHVQDVSWFSRRTSPTDNDRIKYAVSTYGATYVSMSWQGPKTGSVNYDPATASYYYDGQAGTNHGVLVVGWDDDYPASAFATPPPGDGAFLVKNSWGTGFGDGGYFHVSYYDTRFGRTKNVAVFWGSEPPTNYAAIYQYDPLGDVRELGYGSATLWGANAFTATADSAVAAVGFYAEAAGTGYTIYEGPSTTRLTEAATGALPEMGFHTVRLPHGIFVGRGSPFVVAVKLTTPGWYYPLACEDAEADYSSAATASPGQSFFSTDGTTWYDLTTWNPTANACIKAYTVAATPPPVITVTSPDGGTVARRSTQTVAWEVTPAAAEGSFRVALEDTASGAWVWLTRPSAPVSAEAGRTGYTVPWKVTQRAGSYRLWVILYDPDGATVVSSATAAGTVTITRP